jgi:hypothetical protein
VALFGVGAGLRLAWWMRLRKSPFVKGYATELCTQYCYLLVGPREMLHR